MPPSEVRELLLTAMAENCTPSGAIIWAGKCRASSVTNACMEMKSESERTWAHITGYNHNIIINTYIPYGNNNTGNNNNSNTNNVTPPEGRAWSSR